MKWFRYDILVKNTLVILYNMWYLYLCNQLQIANQMFFVRLCIEYRINTQSTPTQECFVDCVTLYIIDNFQSTE